MSDAPAETQEGRLAESGWSRRPEWAADGVDTAASDGSTSREQPGGEQPAWEQQPAQAQQPSREQRIFEEQQTRGEQRVSRERSGFTQASAMAAVALFLAAGSLAWSFLLQRRLHQAEVRALLAKHDEASVDEKLAVSEARMHAAMDTLGLQLGLTKREVEQHADAILRRQVTETARLESTEKQAERRIGAVSTDMSAVKSQMGGVRREIGGVRKDVGGVKREVGGVKREVGGVRQDVASTRSELAATRVQLQRAVGDAGVMSGLIARNHDEVALLRHRGDRTYYEFTLRKGDKPVMLARVRLSLKKLNEKHARYTMLVKVDDREIEKKDKTLDEPVQFYTGKNPVLYEIVVNDIQKNLISGYLSTPRGL